MWCADGGGTRGRPPRGASGLDTQKAPGGLAAWERAFATHYPAVVRHVAYLVGDRAAAEDVAAEAFLRLMRRPLPEGDLGPLLRTTAGRLAFNLLRDQRRRRAREERAGRDRALSWAGGASGDPDAADALARALQALPARDRVVVLLRAAGHPYAEIAAAVGIRPSSVGTILARATARLRAAYLALDPADGARSPAEPGLRARGS